MSLIITVKEMNKKGYCDTETPVCWTFLSPSGIEDLHSKRIELNRQIRQEEEEKERLQHDIQVLSDKLSRVNESLSQRIAARAAFDRTIAETEAAYTKVCFRTSSFVLLLLWPTIILYNS